MTQNSSKRQIPIHSLMEEFFGNIEGLRVEEEEFPGYQTANLATLLHPFLEDCGAEIHTVTGVTRDSYSPPATSELLAEPHYREGQLTSPAMTSPVFARLWSDKVDTRLGFKEGLVLLSLDGEKFAIYCRVTDRGLKSAFVVSVYAMEEGAGANLLRRFERFESSNSIYRGKIIVPAASSYDGVKSLEIAEVGESSWGELVLDRTAFQRLRENTVEHVAMTDMLRHNGFEVKRGVLLHGAPGTGKSLACRIIAGELPGFTTVLVAGQNLEAPAEVFQLARKYEPALLIFEDIDLIGTDRAENSLKSALGELMNELDGVAARDEVYVLFTTNHLHLLEEALSQRPGRVDTVIEFPLPGRALRQRLIEQYAGKARLVVDDIQPLLDATQDQTPVFIKEVLRKALVLGARNGAVDDEGRVTITCTEIMAAILDYRDENNGTAKKIIGFLGT